MRNGLYKVVYRGAGQEWGAGVVVLADNAVQGGDSMTYFTGSLDEQDGAVTATVRVRKHTDVPGMGTMFGADDVSVTLAGQKTPSGARLRALSPNAPEQLEVELSLLTA
jgi:hypothetical protein